MCYYHYFRQSLLPFQNGYEELSGDLRVSHPISLRQHWCGEEANANQTAESHREDVLLLRAGRTRCLEPCRALARALGGGRRLGPGDARGRGRGLGSGKAPLRKRRYRGAPREEMEEEQLVRRRRLRPTR